MRSAPGASGVVRGRAALLGLWLAAAVGMGCSGPAGVAVDDEAMVRARRAGRSPAEAARDFAAPRKDYFPRMDAVGLRSASPSATPDQLLDKTSRRPGAGRPADRKAEPLKLTTQEAIGRNTWMIWCAGNEGFWDWLANNSFGGSDLVKALDGRLRSTRFRVAGLINEPETVAPGAPEPTDYGLWLAVPSDPKRREARAAYLREAFGRQMADGYDPRDYTKPPEGGYGYGPGYEDEEGKVPTPPPEIYGLSSGVIGLRLFPNPNFDAKARAAWDPKRYYEDPEYYSNPELVRPFRVGMSCAFCHTSFHPLKPPRDVDDPAWENLSGNIGAQYLRIRGVFGNLLDESSFVYHLLDSQPPGTIDTSLLPSDNINNTNTMNSVFGLAQRVARSLETPKENQGPASASLPSLWADSEIGESESYKAVLKYLDGRCSKAGDELKASNGDPRRVPRILLDGSDSIGGFGALARVYLNIGSYWEQWNRIHRPIVGFQEQAPFKLDDCEAHSVYWMATQPRVGPMRDYFLKITPPMRLLDADDPVDRTAKVDEVAIRAQAGKDEGRFDSLLARERALRIDMGKLARGRKVFARNCIVCHSSIQPPERQEEMAKYAAIGEFWDHEPGRWLSDPEYVQWADKAVEQEAFWRDNFLSTDYRVPINYVGTNSARAMATNAMTGHMWQDFSSEDYRKLPSVGLIPFFNPFKGEAGEMDEYTPRHKAPAGVPDGGGGPGFYRVPTLISIWATAPLLHNNSLGLFNADPSVDGRLLAFDDAIRKLLWPARRLQSSSYNGATPERLAQDRGLIWRTPVDSYLTVPARHFPYLATTNLEILMKLVEGRSWLRDPRAFWLPTALGAVGLLALLKGQRGFKRRLAFGYAPILAALGLAFVMSFLIGRLGDVRLGPIPAGTPVNLLANINPEASRSDLKEAVDATTKALGEIESGGLEGDAMREVLRSRVAPALMKVSKCPDFVMDKGHDFPWFKSMTDDDKDALIELLKTF